MKRLAFAMAALAIAACALAADAPQPPALAPGAMKIIKDNLPVCSTEATVSYAPLQHKMPRNFNAVMVRVESKRQGCEGQWLAVTTSGGGFFLGIPWFLDDVKDQPTLELRLKTFAWKNLQQNVNPIIDHKETDNGLYKVVLQQTADRGTIALEGEIDPEGTVFFLGHFVPLKNDFRQERLKAFGPIVAGSPVTGAAKPEVTVIEFSDFECPSCQHAAGFMKPLLEKYGDRIRYIRYDLPLVQMHPWALSAALAGHAIYRQKPELFWEYKKQVYANQEQLSAFTFDDFARGFAKDHDLDLKKYDADVTSPELRAEILKGVGIAFANDIRATPTYMVNGVTVDPGDGSSLDKYVAGLLKK
ncbi:MAG TPA: thioredoxin domain-containing protein [Thermoanaerobaculia bacterium]|nr:thioredoxin domain-containing protein [Thermoanaerobaculia bacterium]